MSAPSYVARIRTQDKKDNSNDDGHWLPLASLDPDWQEFLSPGLGRVVFDPFKTLVNTFHSHPWGVILLRMFPRTPGFVKPFDQLK